MKTKRILSVVVAIMLIFNIVTINTFALASGEKASISLKTETGNLTVNPGETISIVLSVDEVDTTSGIGSTFNTVLAGIAYDSTKIDIVEDGTSIKNASVDEYALGLGGFITACDGVTLNTDYTGAAAGDAIDAFKDYAEDTQDITDNGWNSGVSIQLVLSNELTAPADVAKFAFKVADDVAPGTKFTVGIPVGTNEGWFTAIDNKWEGYNVDNATLEFTVASAAAAPTLTHVKTMGQMKNWNDTTATKFNAGLVGCLANYTPVADGNEITSIDYIKVEVTRGTETLTGYAHQLYLQDDGSYWFRAVINNADIADTENLSFKYTIVFTDGTETLTYESTAEDVTSFNGIYTTANNNRLGN